MRRRRLIFVFIPALIVCVPKILCAGQISLVPTTTVSIGKDWVDVILAVRNRGDEDSLAVYPTLKLGNQRIQLKQTPHIAFGGSQQWQHRFSKKSLGFEKKGVYPLFLTLTYHDANMYPFSLPEIIPVNYGGISKGPLPLQGKLALSDIRQKGFATLTLKNRLSSPLDINCHFFSAKELVFESPEKAFTLKGGESRTIKLGIKNHGALVGSTYKILAAVEFIYSDTHLSLILSNVAKVTKTATTNSSRNQIVGIVCFIFMLFLATVYFEIKKAR